MTARKIPRMESASRIAVKLVEKTLHCKSCKSVTYPLPPLTKWRRMKLSPEQRLGAIEVVKRRYLAALRALDTMSQVKQPGAKEFVKGMRLYYSHIKRFLEQILLDLKVPISEWIDEVE